jgi:hypothetical protein
LQFDSWDTNDISLVWRRPSSLIAICARRKNEERNKLKNASQIHQPRARDRRNGRRNVINVINDSETDDVDSSLEALMNGLARWPGRLIDKLNSRRWPRWIFQFAPLDGLQSQRTCLMKFYGKLII